MKLSFAAACGVAIGLLALPASARAQSAAATYELKVHVSYTGSGTVDDKHKIYVALWDSPDFAGSGGTSMPAGIQPLSSKDGVVTFGDVKKTPAYISMVYDASGSWDVQSPPPDGSSLGMYSKNPPEPTAINLKSGAPVSIDVSFDDRVKMQGGKPAH